MTTEILLSRVQKECLERQGQCEGCTHGMWLESGRCQVKHNHGIAEQLGLTPKGPDYEAIRKRNNTRSRGIKTLPENCEVCGVKLVRRKGGTATKCDSCRVAARLAHWEHCLTCGARYAAGRYGDVGTCYDCRAPIAGHRSASA